MWHFQHSLGLRIASQSSQAEIKLSETLGCIAVTTAVAIAVTTDAGFCFWDGSAGWIRPVPLATDVVQRE
ncbi:hypothetical protein VP1G_10650 [Cytospora mali]|uniref:Uncharacterized protein n=1 Tax=Cytospora mali TaxID=578113 RepID=A0A194URK9_CYTMA|nr:hypothetical protein VP1G_10650 [Valsa mali var. pyri (nom. inval.)]